MFLGFAVFLAIVSAFVWYVVTYNNLIAARERVAQAWSSIDVLLRQRHEELPKLVDTFAEHLPREKAAVERVLEARAAIFGARHSSDPADLGRAEGDLRRELDSLFALAASRSELGASPPFTMLKQRIADLATGISERREVYNAAVEENNTAIEEFPGNLLAGMGGFRPAKPLEFGGTSSAGGQTPVNA
jgi:LemA protein